MAAGSKPSIQSVERDRGVWEGSRSLGCWSISFAASYVVAPFAAKGAVRWRRSGSVISRLLAGALEVGVSLAAVCAYNARRRSGRL